MQGIAVFAVALLIAAGASARAAELKCLVPLALKSAISDLVPQYEALSGDKVVVEYGLIGAMAGRLLRGEAADVAILADAQIAELQKQGTVVDGSATGVTKLGFGVFSRMGAAKPDVSSPEAFRQALLTARAVAYVDPATGAPSGIYMAGLIDRLGIAAEMKARTRLTGPVGPLFDAVVSGDAEIGFTLVSEILADRRVAFAGPFPAGIQTHIPYAAGLVATSTQQKAGKEFIAFLTSVPVQAAMKEKGFEPF